MKLLERIHGSSVFPRRVNRLAELLAQAVPRGSSVLDVGCGDGSLAVLLQRARPDLTITGLEVLARATAQIPVTLFDGHHLPFDNRSFDIVMFVDVLHHTEDPMVLLREAARVSRGGVVIKDHTVRGIFARGRLRFMDYVGNARHGVPLPYNYWTDKQWNSAQAQLGLKPAIFFRDLALYPFPADIIFGANLHFLACFEAA